ncbi:4-hydroxybenzoate polyprenyl transferase [Mycena galericulata]|nr:4-hydroxybenzoate polyprenyl transferase [Mycena galericulata]KAJ7513159.1 4-hydroxybenzoate polyprenyl transferase [Mycena galericulata]
MMFSDRPWLKSAGPWLELARFNKPAGALLILWPYIWGLAMSARSDHTPLPIFSQNLVGGSIWFFLLRSAGCIWNDIVDRDLDKQVERTRNRPLANGRILVPGALGFLLLHLVPLLFSVAKYGNKQLLSLALITMFPLAGGYPFMKRITYWPQAWLGIAFNMGPVMASSWVTGNISRSSISLALAGWFWTMWYDTIYGAQDKKDDIKIGIGSTALLFRSTSVSLMFLVFHGLMFTLFLTVSGLLNGVDIPSSPYFLFGVCGAFLHLVKQFRSLDLTSPASCWSTFCSNGFVLGPIVAAGMVADYFLMALKEPESAH